MKPKKVVITGGPGTGKTSLIFSLEKQGYYCYHEIIRAMTSAAKQESNLGTHTSNPLAFVSDPLAFNTKIIKGRLQQFKKRITTQKSHSFFDRGMPDVLAYMDFFKQDYTTLFADICTINKYDFVFITPPWEEIYVSDNERLESFDEAVLIHKHLKKTYLELGYMPTIIPKGTIKNRLDFVLNTLKE